MSKQVNFSHISVYKSQFDILHHNYLKDPKPDELQSVVEKMMGLQGKIVKALERAPVNVSRYFVWTTSTPAEISVDAEAVKEELRIKLEQILAHSGNVPITQKSMSSEVTPITPFSPLPSSSSQSADKPADQATEFAVGFANLSANCWANSLLSMIISMPNFKRAFETVGNYYVQNGQSNMDVLYGNAILNALTAYDNALVQRKPVPDSVSQNIRLAYHHFFGHINPLTSHEIFSNQAWRQEDASEAMEVLMGRYEQILNEQAPHDPLPSPYCQLQTKRHYRPIGNSYPADPQKLARNDYSRLSNDNLSSQINHDYQIILDLQNKGHLSFSELLSEHFCNTHSQGHDIGTYLLPDQNIQRFELIGEGRQFIQTPEELLLTIKRFGATQEGVGFKIASPLIVPRVLVLPAHATLENKPIAYELDTFNVHKGDFGGGHYLAYRKIRGQWIEANDGAVRLVSEQEIDQILHGQKAPNYTSYIHHYSRIDAARQQEVIAASRPAPSRPTEEAEKFSQEVTTIQIQIKLLEALNALLKANADPDALRDAIQTLEKETPQALSTLRYTIWVNDKTPDLFDYGTNALNEHPERLGEATLPWIISSTGKNLVEQLLLVKKHQLEIASDRSNEMLLQSFLEKMQSPTLSNEALGDALKALPQVMKNSLYGFVYQSHLRKFGPQHVHKEEYQNDYGKVALETGDIRKTLTEATESVLNLRGKNILEQLLFDHHTKAEKLQCAYEKEQLQAFHELLLRPANEISNLQLFKAFDRMEIRQEIKEKLHWHIWYGHKTPQIPNYGSNTFNQDPRSLLTVREPNLARAPVCATGSNLLFQMIKLLERDSR